MVAHRHYAVCGLYFRDKRVSASNWGARHRTPLSVIRSILHTPKDDPAYPTSAIAHFNDKLLHIRERLKTEPGKKLAEKRHQFVWSTLLF